MTIAWPQDASVQTTAPSRGQQHGPRGGLVVTRTEHGWHRLPAQQVVERA